MRNKFFKSPSNLLFITFALMMVAGPVFAQQDAGQVAEHVNGQLNAIGKLAIGAMFLAGIGVAAGAAFKFKAHSENAQQVPLKIPLFWAIVAAILIAIPTFLSVGKSTFFGSNNTSPTVQQVQF